MKNENCIYIHVYLQNMPNFRIFTLSQPGVYVLKYYLGIAVQWLYLMLVLCLSQPEVYLSLHCLNLWLLNGHLQ